MLELVPNELTTFKYTPELIVGSEKNTQTPALKSPFLIPIYQRLYTWETEHVERLLLDLWDAYKSPKSDEYFIGALVTTIESDASLVSLELIDGQQRLTTLWLIASVLVKIKGLRTKERWKNFLAIYEKPRLSFSGRDSDITALEEFVLSIDSERNGKDEHNWLSNESMINARKTITLFFNGIESDKDEVLDNFSDYIWKKASFVITQLHPKSDKERFFDTMNSRGIQLEKHEILKSHLLTNLSSKELKAYGKVWDLCADIDGYIPGAIQTKFDYGLSQIDNTQILSVFEVLEKKLTESVSDLDEIQAEVSLKDILEPTFLDAQLKQNNLVKATRYKSPVSFPVFLLHVLRVFVEKNSEVLSVDTGISLDDKKLIESFKLLVKSNNELRKGFIECLFECRLLLDNFIIKGQLEESSEHANWEVTSRLANPDNSTRIKFSGDVWNSISMLQTMMHFSPMNGVQRATWLTQVLKDIRAITVSGYFKENSPKQLLGVFERIDYQYATKLLKGNSIESVLQNDDKSTLGTNVHRYWFYKLEYCLWELWFNRTIEENTQCAKPSVLNKTTSFRMRAVNSIEHVSPQSKKNGSVTAGKLDNFGNLSLISISENSSYSDKDPLEKKSSFVVSYSKGLIQSLKLAHIFSKVGDDVESWNDTTMREHEELMLEVLNESMIEKAE
ncbi:DUF262 domain-containing protein [Colwellia sp. 75C3]|uniref:DUF262 domain-containing protein n=1 Tax=Colwellia sp. 75C3 TaxID=888425 RepID=UPI0018E31BC5|nr:DUF262 domain-containing protein [Colwellia sp. 75C3]